MIPAGPLPVVPLSSPPELIWRVPGSKSITNRALVLAALAEGESTLEGVLHSDDTRHMRSALEAMGIGIQDAGPETLVVQGGRRRLRAPERELFIGNSGTTVRFLAALACLVPGEVVLVGDEHMAKRPIADLVDGLRQLGADVACATGCPPLRIRGGRLEGGTLTMRGDRSSQYFSAVMMAGSFAESAIDLRIAGELVSRPYVEITRRMVADFGGRIDEATGGFTVHPSSGYRPRRYPIEPDASSASYPFALAAAAGGAITVPGLGEGALQGDYRFVELLEQAGARVSHQADATTVRSDGRLRGVDVDMHHISDTVMTLAAIAPLFEGPTTIRNVANIRIKETDRLAATVAELRRLGQEVTHGDDWLRIEPRPLTPALVHSYSDHRMAMSFAILGLCRPGITIENPACVAKTYPTFWEDVERCRGAVDAAPRG
ncbi:3-phosphoshikimate 1-carboxyvinyltransferase [Sorangium sp. So ce1014]|uniref:3-phosphoshikimate 1-carboxyvinyltransferase n=1 Tax=Sorangium sp. So ce1014 TaxID=3133326 RepID=UPI003F6107BE